MADYRAGPALGGTRSSEDRRIEGAAQRGITSHMDSSIWSTNVAGPHEDAMRREFETVFGRRGGLRRVAPACGLAMPRVFRPWPQRGFAHNGHQICCWSSSTRHAKSFYACSLERGRCPILIAATNPFAAVPSAALEKRRGVGSPNGASTQWADAGHELVVAKGTRATKPTVATHCAHGDTGAQEVFACANVYSSKVCLQRARDRARTREALARKQNSVADVRTTNSTGRLRHARTRAQEVSRAVGRLHAEHTVLGQTGTEHANDIRLQACIAPDAALQQPCPRQRVESQRTGDGV
mmetsp:Transcript_56774/g.158074  ORF Transcript_56774/g.158074 Transcript_56774/m.158074 type:complete len:296 (-) Transcript_56774:113-1000(-)